MLIICYVPVRLPVTEWIFTVQDNNHHLMTNTRMVIYKEKFWFTDVIVDTMCDSVTRNCSVSNDSFMFVFRNLEYFFIWSSDLQLRNWYQYGVTNLKNSLKLYTSFGRYNIQSYLLRPIVVKLIILQFDSVKLHCFQ